MRRQILRGGAGAPRSGRRLCSCFLLLQVLRLLLVSLGKDRFPVLSRRAMFSHEPIEWPDEVEELVDRLEGESAERALSREERAVMDVYETVPLLESDDGLHAFWQSGVNQQRVINSFELVGASTLVDPLNAS